MGQTNTPDNHAAKPDTKDQGGNAPESGAPAGTAQGARDAEEKRRHSSSENDLESAQDKNPVPPDATRGG